MRTYQISQSEPPISYDTFYLVELSKMCRIHGLIPEHPIDTEELRWPESIVLFVLRVRSGGFSAMGEFILVFIDFFASAFSC